MVHRYFCLQCSWVFHVCRYCKHSLSQPKLCFIILIHYRDYPDQVLLGLAGQQEASCHACRQCWMWKDSSGRFQYVILSWFGTIPTHNNNVKQDMCSTYLIFCQHKVLYCYLVKLQWDQCDQIDLFRQSLENKYTYLISPNI